MVRYTGPNNIKFRGSLKQTGSILQETREKICKKHNTSNTQEPGGCTRQSEWATGWTHEEPRFDSWQWPLSSLNASRPTLETIQTSSQRVQGHCHRGLSDRGVKPSTHPNLVPRLRISGATPQFPHMPSNVYRYPLKVAASPLGPASPVLKLWTTNHHQILMPSRPYDILTRFQNRIQLTYSV